MLRLQTDSSIRTVVTWTCNEGKEKARKTNLLGQLAIIRINITKEWRSLILIEIWNNCFKSSKLHYIKAILRLFIYKALYDQSYLGSKTTMTTGEWSCLISFAWDPLTCSERRRGSEKFKMKIYVSSGIRTHASPRHD